MSRERNEAAQEGARERGFTLMELLAVMTVLAIAFGITMGGMQGLLPGSRLESGARELRSKIDELRHEAIARGWTVSIEYDLERETYRAWAVAPPSRARELLADEEGKIWLVGQPATGGKFAWEELPEDVDMACVELVDGQSHTNGCVQVQVNPFGIVDTHAIQLHSTSIDYWYTVVVSSLHGLTELIEGREDLQVLEESEF
ncbi:MAG: prepilin-type N-terminal cleavage/methylation domain-containing protein [Planctomycetota bacterium]